MHQFLDLPQIIFTLNACNFLDKIIMVETYRTIKGPYLDFGEFLWVIGIWVLMKANPGTNWTDYFSKNPIDIFSGCSIFFNQYMSRNCFESI